MAIFYEHIKGCGASNSYTSWIKWSNQTSKPSGVEALDCKYLPRIQIDECDFGSIITSKATNQLMDCSFTVLGDLLMDGGYIVLDGGDISIGLGQGISFKNDSLSNIYYKDEQTMVVQAADSNGKDYLELNARSYNFTSAPVFIQKSLHVGAVTNFTENIGQGNIKADGDIKADNKCEALYFNATSDRRAKSNITPAQFSALTIVKNLPIYTFNYTSKPEDKVIGLVAQEAAEYNLDGFNMVDNLDASGENNDFMQIKESKLVYVLWKAVQELSAEVESLKAQLNNK